MSFWRKVKETAEKAVEAAKEVDWKEAASRNLSDAKNWTENKYEELYPKIEEIVVRGLVDISEEALRDEEVMRKILYQTIDKAMMTLNILPGGGFLRETGRTFFLDKMVAYCQTHRELLLAKVQQYKSEKYALADNQSNEFESTFDEAGSKKLFENCVDGIVQEDSSLEVHKNHN